MTSDASAEPLDAAAAGSTVLARETHTVDDRLTLTAVRMAYISFAFFFACFYFADTYLQLVNENGMWKPKGLTHPPSWIGVLWLATMLLSGLVYFGGQWGGLYRRNWPVLKLGLWLAALLALVSLIFHIVELYRLGFGVQAGGYASVFIAAEGVYTAILVATVIAFFGVANRARLGLYRDSGIAVEAFGEFLGFMSAIALMNFLALYVQPFLPATAA